MESGGKGQERKGEEEGWKGRGKVEESDH